VRIFGGNVAPFAKLSRRNHRKTLVTDGRVAFTGGINIAHENASPSEGGAGWRDTNVRLEGPVAAEFQYLFLRTWGREGGAKLDESRYSLDGRRPDPAVRVTASNLGRRRSSIRAEYRRAISQAKHRIWITNCYFIPPPRFLRALSAAARRGVDVQIMVAGTTDVLAVRMASRALYGRLLSAGVKMFEWHGRVLHAKTAVIDGRWSTVGSSNLDHWSLRLSLEANVIIEDASFAKAVESMFSDDLTHCEEFTSLHWTRRPSWERAASWAAHMFREWL
jgi:cardiolipin synthase